MEDLFEEITNGIAVLIKEDAVLNAFCIDKLGSGLNPYDNSITHAAYDRLVPYFVITKGEEKHFFNKGTNEGLKNTFPCTVVFYGDFEEPQVNDDEFLLPSGAVVDVNGVTTFTPSDTMRKIARLSGLLINKKIECKVPQLRVEDFMVFSEDYYDDESGLVGSILELTFYQENIVFNS